MIHSEKYCINFYDPIKETYSSTQFALYGISNKNVQGLNPLSSFQK